jgi:hypothetical protein
MAVTTGSRYAPVKAVLAKSSLVAINALAWVTVNLLVTTLVPPVQAYVWRGPLQTRVEARPVQQPQLPPNLLTSTLGGAAPVAPPFSQDDWPNPVRRAVPLQDWQHRVPLNLLGKDNLLIRQTDWPNPVGPRRSVDLLTWTDSPAVPPPAAVALPFSQNDWPNPVLRPVQRPDYSNTTDLTLLGKDTFFGAPGQPPAPREWPNPRGPARPSAVFDPPNLTNTLQAAPATTFAPFRQPFFTRIVARPGPPLSDPPNLLTTTLRVTAAAPFFQTDWPNPSLRIVQRQDFQNAIELALLGQDRVYGAPGQVPRYDWPNPRAAARTVDLLTWIGLPQIAPPVIAAPFGQPDWPNPVLRIAQRQDWPRGVTLELLGQDVLFGAPGQTRTYDWPVPPAPRRAVDLLTWAPPVSLGILVAPPAPLPFNQGDWPVPRGPLGGIELRTWIQPVALNLLGQDRFFGGPGQPPPNLDWPVPRGAFRPDLTWLQALAAQLTAPPPPEPFALLDWPNPPGPRAATELRTWLQAVPLNLLGRDNLPPFRSDQSVPRGAARSIELLTWLQSLNQATSEPPPFALRDWPNPRGPLHPISLRTWAEPVKLLLLGKDNLLIRQTEWPVVRRVPFLHPELRPTIGTWFHLFETVPFVPGGRAILVPSLLVDFRVPVLLVDFAVPSQRIDFIAAAVPIDFVVPSQVIDFIAPEEGGPMLLDPPIVKQPNETFPPTVDFKNRFKGAEAIATVTVTSKKVSDGSDSSSLLSGPTFSGSIAQVRLAAGVGTPNDDHIVQFRVTTTTGNTFEAEVRLAIRGD